MIISFDFETRSLCDLRQCGAWVYSEHPSTAVLCYSFAIDDGDVISVIGDDLHPALAEALAAGATLRAWNVFFEWAIWHNVCRHWPPLDQVADTMALAAIRNLPQGLEQCAEVLGLENQKDKRGKQLIQILSVPIRGTEEFRELPALLAEMSEYCAQDVRVERDIAETLGDVLQEREAFAFTLRMNLRGVPISLPDVRHVQAVVEEELTRVNGRLAALTGGAVEKVSQAAKLKRWCAEQGVELENLQEETIEAALAELPVTSPVAQALQMRNDANKSSTAKLARLQKIVGSDGTAKGLSVYHGCSTGRMASRGGLNAQNLPRPYYDEATCIAALLGDDPRTWYGDDLMRAAVSTVRGMIRAPAGMEFIDADFSSVENRVGVWLPGQQDKIDMFAAGLDEYKVFASQALYECDYAAVTKDQRQASKSAVLGCLFGQGWRGLIKYARGYNVELSDERSQYIVERYRDDYHAVKAMWYECGEKAITAVQNPGKVYRIGQHLKIAHEAGYLVLRLPSGRKIYWYLPEIRILPTPWGSEVEGVTVLAKARVGHQWVRQHLRGPSIFQSAVQGTARDLMIEAAMRLDQKYPVVLTVHDEILSLVAKNYGSEEEFRHIMSEVPAWATGLPIACESWRGERFRK